MKKLYILFTLVTLCNIVFIRSTLAQDIYLDTIWPVYLSLNIGDQRDVHLLSGEIRHIRVDSATFYGNSLPGSEGEFCSTTLNIDGQNLNIKLYVGQKDTGTFKSLQQPVCINGMYIGIDGMKDFGGITTDILLWLADASRGITPGGKFPFADTDKNVDINEIYVGNTFMNYHYYNSSMTTHLGIDFDLPLNTPLRACYGDTVTYIDPNKNYELQFTDYDRPGPLVFRYGHQNSITVSEGQKIIAGDTVGLSGNKDKDNTTCDPHFHIEMRDFNIPNELPGMDFCFVNPWPYLWQWMMDERKTEGWIQANMASLSPTSVGVAVSFSSQGSQPNNGKDPLSYYWDFGNGQISNDPNPTCTYSVSGIYKVKLMVTDTKPGTSSFEQYITVSESTQISINNYVKKNFNTNVYPIPSKDKLTIEIPKSIKENSVLIYNISGQIVLSYQIKNGKTQLDISNLISGVYFVKCVNDNKAEMIKIIKE